MLLEDIKMEIIGIKQKNAFLKLINVKIYHQMKF